MTEEEIQNLIDENNSLKEQNVILQRKFDHICCNYDLLRDKCDHLSEAIISLQKQLDNFDIDENTVKKNDYLAVYYELQRANKFINSLIEKGVVSKTWAFDILEEEIGLKKRSKKILLFFNPISSFYYCPSVIQYLQ